MNKLSINTLKGLRKLYFKCVRANTLRKPECVNDPDIASNIIYEALIDDKPRMIARFGSVEMSCLINYVGVKKNTPKYIDYIIGDELPWWWETPIINHMNVNAGFFPPKIEKIEKFCELMLQDIQQIDVLGSWLEQEVIFKDELEKTQKVHLRLLEPFWSENPWTRALEGRKILVVHPFENEIKEQYKRKDLIFKRNILPDFELKTVKAVMSFANEKTKFVDWFEALNYMKAEIDSVDYDICLIGAGAYGFSLAAHVKKMGKKSIHMGGSLQLLFGIRGKRWEDPNYGTKKWGIPYGSYSSLMNEYWIRPGDTAKPADSSKVEGSCYW
ncbi:MAG: hypothetical protein P4L34_01050 [Paludibacter sp.]|nr:hypothetical protein [Paludibacter sp.]